MGWRSDACKRGSAHRSGCPQQRRGGISLMRLLERAPGLAHAVYAPDLSRFGEINPMASNTGSGSPVVVMSSEPNRCFPGTSALGASPRSQSGPASRDQQKRLRSFRRQLEEPCRITQSLSAPVPPFSGFGYCIATPSPAAFAEITPYCAAAHASRQIAGRRANCPLERTIF
jgi:hypothetical protein